MKERDREETGCRWSWWWRRRWHGIPSPTAYGHGDGHGKDIHTTTKAFERRETNNKWNKEGVGARCRHYYGERITTITATTAGIQQRQCTYFYLWYWL